jgi:hypothetical protein
MEEEIMKRRRRHNCSPSSLHQRGKKPIGERKRGNLFLPLPPSTLDSRTSFGIPAAIEICFLRPAR